MKLQVTAISFVLLISSMDLTAQAPSAPMPAQIAAAKTVFLANAGSPNNQLAIIAYDNLYQAFASGNRYHLTATPADADLIFEVSVIETDALVGYVKLVIQDSKSHSLLWTTYEGIGAAGREKTFETNVAKAAVKFATDLTTLTSATVATPPPAVVATKTRFSDEKK